MTIGDAGVANFQDRDLREELLRRRLAGRPASGDAAAARVPREIGPAARDGDLPLSFGQQQMWFLNRWAPESPEYLMPLVLRLRGPLCPETLRLAFTEVLRRHEILRTRYRLAGAVPVQVIGSVDTVPAMDSVDLTELALEERESTAWALLEQELATPFDLEREAPIRARLIRLSDDEHLLIVVMHHIAGDDGSLEIFTGELAALYGSGGEPKNGELPALSVQYADYAAWQRNHRSAAQASGSAYWQRQLAGLGPLELPTDRPRPVLRDWHGATVPFAVAAPVADALRAIAREQHTTPFVVLLTAFQVLLARHTGTTDLAVGTPVTARTRAEIRDLIGYLVNTLVLRARWSGDPSFTELLVANRSTLLDALEHQDVPFSQLVDDLQPDRDLARTPLFQVAFAMHESADAVSGIAGVAVERVAVPSTVAKFDLSCHLQEEAGGPLRGVIEYATALFEPDTVRRLADRYLRLLDGIAAAPDTRVSAFALLEPTELALLSAGGRSPSAAELPSPSAACLHELFESRAAATPDAVAVVSGGASRTYAELDAHANRLAHALRERGAGPDSLVGVCLEPGIELVATLLGVLKSGAGYLPLDPSHPTERLGWALSDAGAEIVVTDAAHAATVTEAATRSLELLLLDRDHEAIAAMPATTPENRTAPDNLGYVIYTSGSTGKPKGVAVTHANVVRLFAATKGHFEFGPQDTWTLFHSYAFDFSVWELWGALLHGGRLVIVGGGVSRSPEEFLDLLVAEQVTVLNQTPSAFRALTDAARRDDPRMRRLALRTVIFGGEHLDVRELEPWIARLGVERPELINMYGITETTVHVSHRRITMAENEYASNSVGRPIADLRSYVLDRDGNLAPIGVPGEIHVGGPGLARGYLGRPDLTAERFVPDPFGPPGARLYRTGDLGRVRPDGELEHLGRIDSQVKVRGYRIELGEIQSVLAGHPGLRDAVVVVREDIPGIKELVAYVIRGEDSGGAPEPAELKDWTARSLPVYMIPSAFVAVDHFPLTTSGKLDWRLLPAPGRAIDRAVRGYRAPGTGDEAVLAEIWETMLRLDQVGVDDDFFDLGGDSIKAVVLVGAIRAAGFDVTVRDVFRLRTVARLADMVAEHTTALVEEPTVAPFSLLAAADTDRVRETDVTDAYPLSQVQAGMIFEMLSSAERTYHNVTAFKVLDDRPFSPAALKAAAAMVVGRHEVLRTSIDLFGYTEPLQLVHRTAEMSVGMDDLRRLDDEAQRQAVHAHIELERANPFDLGNPPLLRVFAQITSETDWWLVITECHAILEGWSYHSLLMELLRCYREIRAGAVPVATPMPAVRYADYVAAERAALTSAEDRGYWSRVVSEGTKFELPAHWGDLAAPREMYQVPVAFHDLEDGLRALAAEAGVPMKSVVHAAHLKVLSMLTFEDTFFAGLVCDTRPERLGADQVYGMYLNTVPFAFRGSASTWRELVQQVFAQEIELWPHRRFPLSAMQNEFAGGRRLVDVFFNYLDFHMVDRDLVDYAMSVDASPNEFALSAATQDGHVVLTTNTAAVSRANGARLGAMYRAVLVAMAAAPGGDAVAAYLPAGEREQVLAAWNDTAAPRRIACVHELFEIQVAKNPDAVAVTFAGTRMTYAELDARANRYAHLLRARGVGPEQVVGVLVDRGPELVPCLLGVWKAGGAYVPLDQTYPAERLAYMLTDAGANIVLTHSDYAELLADILPADDYLLVDRDRELIDAQSGEALPPAAGVDNLAYVIYTSGSTGRPKGVLVPHRGVTNYLWWCVEGYAAQGSGGAPLFSSIAFDMVVPDLYTPLIMGEAVHVLPQQVEVDDLGRLLVESGPYRFIKMTPGHLDLLTAQLTAGEAADLAPLLAVGADAFPRRTLERWRVLGAPSVLLNEYGPTEISVANCTYEIAGDQDGELVPIGKPIPNTTMYVLDENMEPAPIGALGELYVGGVGVVRGYANMPDVTADRFVPDPFGMPGSRLYRTGDLCRVRPDGNIVFVDRVDHQVKVRGYRIETGEIQTVLTGHPEIRDALVVARRLADTDKQLIAYCVAEGAKIPGRDALIAHCKQTLPEYMVPTLFIELDKIPLNQNGKVDRNALPAPELTSLAASRTYLAPRTETEVLIASVWRRVLDLERIGVHHDFFELGGHSLLMLRVVAQAQELGLALSTADLLECRTVAELAAKVDRADTATRSLVWLSPNRQGTPIFCVHPVGGSIHWFRPLAERIGPQRPVAAFAAKAIRDEAAPPSVAMLAEDYLAELAETGPDGPVHLLAWSSGAAVAWEMARQLIERGEPAPILTLIDPAIDRADSATGQGGAVDEQFFAEAERLFAIRAAATGASRASVEETLIALLRLAGVSAQPELLDELAANMRTWRLLDRSMSAYRYGPLAARVHLVLTDECATGTHSVTGGRGYAEYLDRWRSLALRGLRIDRIAGDHQGVFEPSRVDALLRYVPGTES
ncbi:amino acid adenylation domain-containing protein [Nocardia sp. NPDC050175]|uniref:amino acid adenylation domain-containing protein n=1 Tax=Nocardia sp. NPDC050175 TaxID=3364317 RepID=UPI0037A9B686